MGIGGRALRSNGATWTQKIFKGIGLDKAIERTAANVSKDLNEAEAVLDPTNGKLKDMFAKEIEGHDTGKAQEILDAKRKELANNLGMQADSNGKYGKAGLDMMGISQEDFDKGIDEGKDLLSEAFANRRKELAKGGIGGIYGATNSAFGTGLDLAGQYYMGGKTSENLKHIAGTYAVGALGARMLSGGTPVTNSNGERDIVGVPFI